MTEEKELEQPGVGIDGDSDGPAAGQAEPDSFEEGQGREAEGGSAPGDDADTTEVDELRDELETLNDKHLRLAAEFDNYRKRNERARAAQNVRMQADLVGSLLDVLDDLQRVEQSAGTDVDSVLEGVRLVEKKFLTVLENAGLESLHVEESRFDPEVMEALMTVPTDDPEKDGHVADVFQKGYRFRDVLIRPARVRVWQHSPEEGE